MADGLPDARHPIDGAHSDRDREQRQGGGEYRGPEHIPVVPPVDQRLKEWQAIGKPERYGTDAERSDQDQEVEEGNFRDSGPDRAEKSPHAIERYFQGGSARAELSGCVSQGLVRS